MKITMRLAILVIIIGFITGCSTSGQEAIQASKAVAEDTFKLEKNEANETANGINYYLPSGFSEEQENENNIILTKGSKEYILFINPLEDPTSQEIFESLRDNKDTELQSFSDDERFGYISITPMKDKVYELIVGIGGVKLTTQTTANDMAENTQVMMEIVHSVEYENQE